MNWQIVRGLVLRHTYLYRRSVPRMIEMVFWPLMDLLVWGFLTVYLKDIHSGPAGAVTYLLGAMIFWDILFRSQQGVTMSFLEDIWSRNILNVFVAPVRVREFLAATYLVGLFKVVVIVVLLSTLSILLYHFNIYDMGLGLVPFFANLILMGWGLGMVATALILRYGQSVETLAWAIPFLLQPLAAVFYPVSVLPHWLQPVSWCLPATHVFEGMRAVLRGEGFPMQHLLWASVLNVVFYAVEAWFFSRMFASAREKGFLAKLATR